MISPRIAVSLKDNTPLRALGQMKKAGIDVAELRVDQFASTDPAAVLRQIARVKGMAVLATIRSKKEGGAWKGSEARRLALYKAVIPKVRMIDIELSSKAILKEVLACAKKHKVTAIVSYHNFKSTPSKTALDRLLKNAKAAGADITKIAVMPRGPKDVQRLLDFTRANAKKKIITISMGAKGMISRVLFPRLGSLLTYASLEKALAPGQMPYQTLLKLLGR